MSFLTVTCSFVEFTFPKKYTCRETTYFIKLHFFPISEEDEEVFEDNPEEYIRRDIEGSGTRKNFNLQQLDGCIVPNFKLKRITCMLNVFRCGHQTSCSLRSCTWIV